MTPRHPKMFPRGPEDCPRHQIIPASDPNGRFAASSNLQLLGHLGLFATVRTSWAFRLLGLLGLLQLCGLLGLLQLLGLLGLLHVLGLLGLLQLLGLLGLFVL